MRGLLHAPRGSMPRHRPARSRRASAPATGSARRAAVAAPATSATRASSKASRAAWSREPSCACRASNCGLGGHRAAVVLAPDELVFEPTHALLRAPGQRPGPAAASADSNTAPPRPRQRLRRAAAASARRARSGSAGQRVAASRSRRARLYRPAKRASASGATRQPARARPAPPRRRGRNPATRASRRCAGARQRRTAVRPVGVRAPAAAGAARPAELLKSHRCDCGCANACCSSARPAASRCGSTRGIGGHERHPGTAAAQLFGQPVAPVLAPHHQHLAICPGSRASRPRHSASESKSSPSAGSYQRAHRHPRAPQRRRGARPGGRRPAHRAGQATCAGAGAKNCCTALALTNITSAQRSRSCQAAATAARRPRRDVDQRQCHRVEAQRRAAPPPSPRPAAAGA